MLVRLLASAVVTLAFAVPAHAAVVVHPSSQSIPPAGVVPGGTQSISLNTAIGEREGAWIVVTGARSVSQSVDAPSLGPLRVEVAFGHFVSFGRKLVPDALLPWDGSARPTEHANQPLYVRVIVPPGTSAGRYRATITIHADGRATRVPLSVRVFPVVLPPPGRAQGNMLSSFHFSPETYVNKVDALYGFADNTERAAANRALFAWLAGYRISPASWGFGEPKSPNGYEASSKWWLDSAGNMARQVDTGLFSALRIPISNEHRSRPIGGQAPDAPEGWCGYLKRVHEFWRSRGWLQAALPYVYGVDEPGAAELRLVARQAKATHTCFRGGKQLLTGNPTARNSFLWDNRGDDDIDVWSVLVRRWYGKFTVPSKQRTASRARQNLASIEAVRRRGKDVWSYTYSGVPGAPGLRADEPLANSRLYLLWNALEGTDGVLYGQGTTNYTAGNPLTSVLRGGEFVLLYPGRSAPIPSARLEQIRDGLEDAAIFNIVRGKRGAAAVRSTLGASGLFSADAAGVKLACNFGCELKGSRPYSWPRWSHDRTTARRIEAAKLQALILAG